MLGCTETDAGTGADLETRKRPDFEILGMGTCTGYVSYRVRVGDLEEAPCYIRCMSLDGRLTENKTKSMSLDCKLTIFQFLPFLPTLHFLPTIKIITCSSCILEA